jgi:hypothetical protein
MGDMRLLNYSYIGAMALIDTITFTKLVKITVV